MLAFLESTPVVLTTRRRQEDLRVSTGRPQTHPGDSRRAGGVSTRKGKSGASGLARPAPRRFVGLWPCTRLGVLKSSTHSGRRRYARMSMCSGQGEPNTLPLFCRRVSVRRVRSLRTMQDYSMKKLQGASRATIQALSTDGGGDSVGCYFRLTNED